MRRLFYFRLAAVNIKRNGKAYLPYLLTCILTVAMYYIMKSLSLNEGLRNVIGGGVVSTTLMLGSVVVAVFAFIFLFYTNSFLMKNRKKEFGLYQILGLEKKHLARMIACESLYIALLSLLGGLGAGMLLDKLMYLIVMRIIHAEIALDYYISADSVRYTLILFAVLFVLILLNSLRTVSFSKPIELLKGGNVGEREPKVKWFAALLGAVSLGGGYYLAVMIENPVDALVLFFIAVILVIAGTYLLFMTGSIAVLKCLKRNKRYYYQPKHFISVSGMIYRMKQNAVGLANICILSTMVLVMISSTSALMIGMDDILTARYPYEFSLTSRARTEEGRTLAQRLFSEAVREEAPVLREESAYTSLTFSALYEPERSEFTVKEADGSVPSGSYGVIFAVTAEDYEKNTGRSVSLAEDEVILYTMHTGWEAESFALFGKRWRVKETTDEFVKNGEFGSYIVPTYGMVVKDLSVMKELDKEQKVVYREAASDLVYLYQFNTGLTEEEQLALRERLRTALPEKRDALGGADLAGGFRLDSRAADRQDMYGLYGSFFFLGMFLGLLFIAAAVLIIYYKQVSEGYDDQERFEIMQKVGMSAREVKRTIHSQVLTVFFLPLLTAGLHVLFAFPMISRILTLFQLTNTVLYICCTAGCFMLFAVVYAVIYFLTAKAYYKIVRRQTK